MTIFVLEGPDYAGKTTFARNLSAALIAGGESVVLRHTGQPDLNGQTPLAQVYLAAVSDVPRGHNVIYDRLHVGELVYGPLFRGGSAISRAEMEAIDSVLLDRGAQLFYVRPPDATLLKRFRGGRGDDLVTREEDLIAAASAYDLLIGPQSMTSWRHISADNLTDQDIAVIVDRRSQ